MFGRCPHWTEDTDSGEMLAPQDPEKPIHLPPHPLPSPGAVLLLPQAPRSFPAQGEVGKVGIQDTQPPVKWRHQKSAGAERNMLKILLGGVSCACLSSGFTGTCLPHRSTRPWNSEKQLITGQGFLPLQGL